MQRYGAAFARAGLGAGDALRLRAGGRGLLLRPAAAARLDRAGRRLRRRHQRLLGDALRERSGGSPRPARGRLGHSGIGIAGDTFDYRIIDHVVSPPPRQGRRTTAPSARCCRCPTHYFANFARWNQLAMMKANGDLKELRELARQRRRARTLERFIEVIEYDQGFPLYRAVSARQGRPVDAAQSVDFRVQGGRRRRSRPRITRAAISRAGSPTTSSASARPCSRRCGGRRRWRGRSTRCSSPGGSSFIPAVRRLFAERFGEEQARLGRPVRIDRGRAGAHRTRAGSGGLDGAGGVEFSPDERLRLAPLSSCRGGWQARSA